jgi:hypothetical protein
MAIKPDDRYQMTNSTIKFSNEQLAAGEERHLQRVLDESLTEFENDMKDTDPKLASDIANYRNAGNMDVFKRIIKLTNIGEYQRVLLAMVLQSGIDVTSNENFHYILHQPTLTGNTKARHLILMALAIQQSKG